MVRVPHPSKKLLAIKGTLFPLVATGCMSTAEKVAQLAFTQSTVSIRRGNFIYVYNNKGSQASVIPAGN